MPRVCTRSYREITGLHPTYVGLCLCFSAKLKKKSQGNSEDLEERGVWGRGSGGEGLELLQ